MTRPPVQGLTKLFLTIQTPRVTRLYKVFRIQPEAGASVAWRLVRRARRGVESSDVWRDEWGEHCTCGDFVWCREHKDAKGCKHVAALRSVGLL